MKFLKWLGIVVIVLAAVLLIGGYLLPSTFTVARSVTIQAPPEKIYALVADPKGWKQWSVWNRRDPAMQIVYSGPPSGVGAKWEWKSKSQGDGAMTFTAAEPTRRVGFDLYFPDFGTTSQGDLRFVPQGNATEVTWTMNGDMGRNPLFHWMALMAGSMVGKDFDAGLAGLKEVAEKP
jgi:uncharacterized protein YndB with AHSA1/START domain